MKKLDKLVLGSFIGPFVLTLLVVDFILLLVTLLRYFDKIMGKGLSLSVFAELIAYFSVSSSPDAFPLAVLLSAIMTFGNLGEHSELTAVKSSGISLVRSLLPIFIFVLGLTAFTYYSNTQLVPKVNLKTYSLLWDMRTKKPALDIRQGVFYNGLPGYSIKVNNKVDDERLKDIIIYDHATSNTAGNRTLILADSGRMYSFMNQRYLALELFNGLRYEESYQKRYEDRQDGGQFRRDRFRKSKIVFDLSSFEMGEKDEKLFRHSRLVKTRRDLIIDIDSMHRDIYRDRQRIFSESGSTFRYHFVHDNMAPPDLIAVRKYYDSLHRSRSWQAKELLNQADSLAAMVSYDEFDEETVPGYHFETRDRSLGEISAEQRVADLKRTGTNPSKVKPPNPEPSDTSSKALEIKKYNLEEYDKIFDDQHATLNKSKQFSGLNQAVNNARTMRNLLKNRMSSIENTERDQRKFRITKNQQMSRSLTCLIMFLIGAPIGAIIKKGGLGLPVIVSVIFFLVYHIVNTTADKWAKGGIMDPALAVWLSNIILLPFGLFFLRQARNDARLFERDLYLMWWAKLRKFFQKPKQLKIT